MERLNNCREDYEDTVRTTTSFDSDFLKKSALGYYINKQCEWLFMGWKIAANYYCNRDISDLYYEAHITIEPVFDDERIFASNLCKPYGFKLADLLMKKRKQDTEERSSSDTFITGHSKSYKDIAERTKECVIQV